MYIFNVYIYIIQYGNIMYIMCMKNILVYLFIPESSLEITDPDKMDTSTHQASNTTRE